MVISTQESDIKGFTANQLWFPKLNDVSISDSCGSLCQKFRTKLGICLSHMPPGSVLITKNPTSSPQNDSHNDPKLLEWQRPDQNAFQPVPCDVAKEEKPHKAVSLVRSFHAFRAQARSYRGLKKQATSHCFFKKLFAWFLKRIFSYTLFVSNGGNRVFTWEKALWKLQKWGQ